MKLASARQGQVVRNTRNGSFYRFEGLQQGRVRILPLELFPNRLLLEKPTPTTVNADLEVEVIGDWEDGMVVEGKPGASRGVYERELLRLEQELPELLATYEGLPKAGKGHESRGSWANKVKCCRQRIATLKRGLGFIGDSVALVARVEKPTIAVRAGDLVLMPSGRAAQVTAKPVVVGDQLYAPLRMMVADQALTAMAPVEVMRPWADARLCTF